MRPAHGILWLLLASVPLLTNCSKQEEGSYYEAQTVPAESETAAAENVAEDEALPPGHPPLDDTPPAGTMPDAGMGMGPGSLSPDMVGRGDAPGWTLPAGWVETEAQSMRRANFTLGESGLEVAVTAFPGDVGGLPANINRWRAQLGLPPVAQTAMVPFVTELQVDGQGVLVVDLLGPPPSEGATQRMLTAVTFHEGSSWFFKLVGDAPAVEKQRPAFLEFLQSLEFGQSPAGL